MRRQSSIQTLLLGATGRKFFIYMDSMFGLGIAGVHMHVNVCISHTHIDKHECASTH